VKAIVWLQPAAMLLACTEIADTGTDYKAKITALDLLQYCILGELNRK
jgi:hypothetical protein